MIECLAPVSESVRHMYSLFLLVILQACDFHVNSLFTCYTVEFVKSLAGWESSLINLTLGHILLAQILQPCMLSVLSLFWPSIAGLRTAACLT